MHLAERGYTPETMPQGSLQDFVAGMVTKRLLPATVNSYIVAAKVYLGWLKDKGLAVAPWKNPKLPRVRNRLVIPLDVNKLRDFMVGVRTLREPFASAVSFLPMTGLRLKEMTSLKVAHVMPVPGKGYMLAVLDSKGDDRLVPFLPQATYLLTNYILNIRPKLPINEWLFPSWKLLGKAISPQVVEKELREVMRQIGYPNVTPHMLRHTYATLLKKSGMSDLAIARILGHKHVQTTMRYVHFDNADLFRDLEKVDASWIETRRQP